MSTYSEQADLDQLINEIRHLGRTRVHNAARQIAHPQQLTMRSALALKNYLERRPLREGMLAAADIAAQVEHASQQALGAMQAQQQGVIDEKFAGQTARTSDRPGQRGHEERDQRSQRAPEAERIRGEDDEGYYLHDGKMYKVATSQYGASQGHLFARRLNEETGDWERAQGMTSYLRKSEKITLEQAVEFGRQLEITPQMALYGRCWICKRVLTDEESIRNRVGPGPHIGIDG